MAVFKAAGGGFLSRGSKFSPLDVKRVYFGTWAIVTVGSIPLTFQVTGSETTVKPSTSPGCPRPICRPS